MAQVVTFDAEPGRSSIDPTKTAVIVVDMQNDFGSKGGMFDRAGIDISGIQEAVAPTARVLAAPPSRAACRIAADRGGWPLRSPLWTRQSGSLVELAAAHRDPI